MKYVDKLLTMRLNSGMARRRTEEDVRIQGGVIRLLERKMDKDGITKAELARRFGCSKSWVTMIMKNIRGLSFGDVWKLAALLKVSPAELLPMGDPGSETPESIDEHIERKVAEILARPRK
jgi:transcriptional regulator with XRE-family HTH domain